MHNVLIAGAGRIGTLIACLLAGTQDYQVYVVDIQFNNTEFNRLHQQFANLKILTINVQKQQALAELVKQYSIQTIISCLPYYCNSALAKLAKELKLNYFDVTEDVQVSNEIQQLAKNAKTIFMPHCGIAPGFVNIAAHTLMQGFDELDTAKLRVGALPQYIDNALHYALTWSTDGLINEYGNAGQAIENRTIVSTEPLADLESLILTGVRYEAFNTSGGLGTLINTYQDKIKYLNYKTIRYPGHCEKMRFLMQDLKLNQDRQTLKTILDNALPRAQQDIAIIYIAVSGKKANQFVEEIYFNKIYPQTIANTHWSAIQLSTASSACAVIDLTLTQQRYHGFVLQEQFTLADVFTNRFGKYIK